MQKVLYVKIRKSIVFGHMHCLKNNAIPATHKRVERRAVTRVCQALSRSSVLLSMEHFFSF